MKVSSVCCWQMDCQWSDHPALWPGS